MTLHCWLSSVSKARRQILIQGRSQDFFVGTHQIVTHERRRRKLQGGFGGMPPPENFEIQSLGNAISCVLREVFSLNKHVVKRSLFPRWWFLSFFVTSHHSLSFFLSIFQVRTCVLAYSQLRSCLALLHFVFFLS